MRGAEQSNGDGKRVEKRMGGEKGGWSEESRTEALEGEGRKEGVGRGAGK